MFLLLASLRFLDGGANILDIVGRQAVWDEDDIHACDAGIYVIILLVAYDLDDHAAAVAGSRCMDAVDDFFCGNIHSRVEAGTRRCYRTSPTSHSPPPIRPHRLAAERACAISAQAQQAVQLRIPYVFHGGDFTTLSSSTVNT